MPILKRVTFEDSQDPTRQRHLADAVARLLQSPTAVRLVQDFDRMQAAAHVAFGPINGTRRIRADGRPTFHGPRAYTNVVGGQSLIILNQEFLQSDEETRDTDMAAALAHELLGHGLWYQRAAKHRMLDAAHVHDLNELNARLIGWIVEMEVSARLGDREAWTFLRDPDGYLAALKLRNPFYALTYSSADMRAPLAALSQRLDQAKARIDELGTHLKRHRSWNHVISHFILVHGMNAGDFNALRLYMAETDQWIEEEIEQAKAAQLAIQKAAEHLASEADSSSLRYLASAANHKLFGELQVEVDQLIDTLRTHVEAKRQAAQTGDHLHDPRAADHWDGQITFTDLVALYENDTEHFQHDRADQSRRVAPQPVKAG
jgi:hypothetical protein